jgi:hypothetical protein
MSLKDRFNIALHVFLCLPIILYAFRLTYAFIISLTRATFRCHLILLCLVTFITFLKIMKTLITQNNS